MSKGSNKNKTNKYCKLKGHIKNYCWKLKKLVDEKDNKMYLVKRQAMHKIAIMVVF